MRGLLPGTPRARLRVPRTADAAQIWPGGPGLWSPGARRGREKPLNIQDQGEGPAVGAAASPPRPGGRPGSRGRGGARRSCGLAALGGESGGAVVGSGYFPLKGRERRSPVLAGQGQAEARSPQGSSTSRHPSPAPRAVPGSLQSRGRSAPLTSPLTFGCWSLVNFCPVCLLWGSSLLGI
ncbi:uncharacterized protein LOC116540333 [Sapajus apella]|uniref:Uncharacterized protein LOC116540333 n=1 Tax=Sapajus apella TaxID=9515 RepID=A0A6J3GNP9_SAPAP|nr:uncharacterized protein LOC116540333 [Sapajus apella]